MSEDVTISFNQAHAKTLEDAAEHLRGMGADPTTEPGSKRLDDATIRDLLNLRAMARATADALSEAIKAQSDACGLSRSALLRYICALEADDFAKLDAEVEDLARLLTRESSD